MHTIKVVIIGDSGVGKTSLRNQYTTSRFSPSYRATIGLDFHSTQLTAPPCTLQIWDTAGQDRFAPLSRAFFRGADAVLLVFDCTKPRTLDNLKRWWGEFESVEGVEGVVVVGVGSKLDLRREGGVAEEDARVFLDELLPERSERRRRDLEEASRSLTAPASPSPLTDDASKSLSQLNNKLAIPISASQLEPSPDPSPPSEHLRRSSTPIATTSQSRSHQRGRSLSNPRPLVGTLTSIATLPSVYHTPSSSFFDQLDAQVGRAPTPPATPPPVRRRLSSSSSQDTLSSSSRTITPPRLGLDSKSRPAPSEDILEEHEPETPDTELESEPEPEPAPEPEVKVELDPALFFTSSLDRSSICPVFEYVARRVIQVREEEDRRRAEEEVECAEATGTENGRRRRGQGWVKLGMPSAPVRCCGA